MKVVFQFPAHTKGLKSYNCIFLASDHTHTHTYAIHGENRNRNRNRNNDTQLDEKALITLLPHKTKTKDDQTPDTIRMSDFRRT